MRKIVTVTLVVSYDTEKLALQQGGHDYPRDFNREEFDYYLNGESTHQPYKVLSCVVSPVPGNPNQGG